MASISKTLLLLAVGSVVLLYLGSQSEAASNFDCCLSYTKVPLRNKFIVGFTKQTANEACDINAIIFHTKRKLDVCANPKDDWVQKAIRFLSQKVKKM